MKDLERGVTPENIATRRNMDRWAHLRPVAFSPATGEKYSATSGDYFTRGQDDPLTDDLFGEPLVLVVERTQYIPVDEMAVPA